MCFILILLDHSDASEYYFRCTSSADSLLYVLDFSITTQAQIGIVFSTYLGSIYHHRRNSEQVRLHEFLCIISNILKVLQLHEPNDNHFSGLVYS